MSDVVVVIADREAQDLDGMVAELERHGLGVSNVNRSEGVIEGVVEAAKVRVIDGLPGVEYVRTVFTYVANYPPGDPRDRDGN